MNVENQNIYQSSEVDEKQNNINESVEAQRNNVVNKLKKTTRDLTTLNP